MSSPRASHPLNRSKDSQILVKHPKIEFDEKMKSDCYPISPTCTPPPVVTNTKDYNDNLDKKAKNSQFINRQTEASSPESIPDKQQPSALLSPSSSSGASYTEEDDLNHRTNKQPNNSKKANGEQAVESNADSRNQSESTSSTQNSKLEHQDDKLNDKLQSIRLKHLQHQRSLKSQDKDFDKEYEANGDTNGRSKHATKCSDEDSNEDEINVDVSEDDKADDCYLSRRTRDIKEDNRLNDVGKHDEQPSNESDRKPDPNEEATKYKTNEDDEEELFKQQFRNHFKKRHLINGDSLASSFKLVTDSGLNKKANGDPHADDDEPAESIDLTTTKKSDSPVDYANETKSTSDLYAIYKHFYENYLNQHLNYMNGDPKPIENGLKNGDLKPLDLKASPNGDEPIDLKQSSLKRSNEFNHFNGSKSNGDYASANHHVHSFDQQLAVPNSVLNNLDNNKYLAANLANHETLSTLDNMQNSRLKNMLYTGKLPDSMDTLENYIQYYNGLNSLNGFSAMNLGSFTKLSPAADEFDYRKSYGSLLPKDLSNGLKNGADQPSKHNDTNKLSSALNPNHNNNLPIKLSTDHLNKSLSKSLNSEHLITNGQLIAKSPNSSLLFSPGQTSPPINFLNYPRPNPHAMKPNSYHQFLCNLQQQSSKTDLSISNLNNTAAVGGALSNSRRKLFIFLIYFSQIFVC